MAKKLFALLLGGMLFTTVEYGYFYYFAGLNDGNIHEFGLYTLLATSGLIVGYYSMPVLMYAVPFIVVTMIGATLSALISSFLWREVFHTRINTFEIWLEGRRLRILDLSGHTWEIVHPRVALHGRYAQTALEVFKEQLAEIGFDSGDLNMLISWLEPKTHILALAEAD